MIVAAVLFAVAAAGGILLALHVARGTARPLGVVLAHGAFAAAGLVALIVAVTGDVPTIAGWSLGLFAVAALGGFVLFGLDRTNRPLPLAGALGHGVIAVIGFVLLLVGIASNG